MSVVRVVVRRVVSRMVHWMVHWVMWMMHNMVCAGIAIVTNCLNLRVSSSWWWLRLELRHWLLLLHWLNHSRVRTTLKTRVH